MSYSLDLRKKVINYIENGGSITAAAQHYDINRSTIYRWLKRDDLAPTKVEHRPRKLDIKALEQDVKDNPNSRLIDRAKKFNVKSINTISVALKKMNITRKKKQFLDKERTLEARITYVNELHQLIQKFGKKSYMLMKLVLSPSHVVYMDGQKKVK